MGLLLLLFKHIVSLLELLFSSTETKEGAVHRTLKIVSRSELAGIAAAAMKRFINIDVL